MAGLEQLFDKDDIGLLDFNATVAYRLEIHEVERDKSLAKLIAYEVSKMFSSGEEQSEQQPVAW